MPNLQWNFVWSSYKSHLSAQIGLKLIHLNSLLNYTLYTKASQLVLVFYFIFCLLFQVAYPLRQKQNPFVWKPILRWAIKCDTKLLISPGRDYVRITGIRIICVTVCETYKNHDVNGLDCSGWICAVSTGLISLSQSCFYICQPFFSSTKLMCGHSLYLALYELNH